MRRELTHRLAIVLLTVMIASPVHAEGIASTQWISHTNIEKLPRHQITIVCLPDPKDPDLLNVRMIFKLESGHSPVGVNIYMGGVNTDKGGHGDRFSGALFIVDNRCSFTVSRKLLDRIELGYRVAENSYSGHVFAIKGTDLPGLSTEEKFQESQVPPNGKKTAEQAVDGNPH